MPAIENLTRKHYPLLIFAILTIIVFVYTVNSDLPYEQDEGGKAAKVEYMVKTNTIFQPISDFNFYRDGYFSLYYVISAIGYKLLGGNIITYLNFQSVLIGMIFMVILLVLFKYALNIDFYATWLVVINMPIIILTFTYGNEVAFSFTFFVISLLFLSFNFKNHLLFSALFYCAAFYSRPDVILLYPFWLGWFYYVNRENFNLKNFVRQILVLNVFLFALVFVYWVIFLRIAVLDMFDFDYSTNIKLLISYLSYPFNLTIIILGLAGLIYLYKNDRKLIGILSLLLIPLFYYLGQLWSPKYIIWLSLFFGIPASILFARLTNIYKVVVAGLVMIWWLVSITPYGISGPGQGEYLFIPSADGAIPTGSYLTFYKKVHQGFYQLKYKGEIESLDHAIDIMASSQKDTRIIGLFNGQFYIYNLVEKNLYDDLDYWLDKWSIDEIPDDPSLELIMIPRSYIGIKNYPEEMKGFLKVNLEKENVKNLYGENTFPNVIEIGDKQINESDPDLGDRILFAQKYYREYAIVQSSFDPYIYLPTYWICIQYSTDSKYDDVIYRDNEYIATLKKYNNSEIWITEIPFIYLNEKDPRIVE